jgi:hypothetical protein
MIGIAMKTYSKAFLEIDKDEKLLDLSLLELV